MSNDLDLIYNSMHVRNKPLYPTDLSYNTDIDNGNCYAIYSLNYWKLTASWKKLYNWLSTIIPQEYRCLYQVHPTNNEGKLHQTLLQFISFNNISNFDQDNINRSIEHVKNIIELDGEYIKIKYIGLVWTKTGLAFKGYPCDNKKYSCIMKLRQKIKNTLITHNLPCDIPYDNDIVHATCLRWVKIPSQDIIDILNEKLSDWNECVFGEMTISNWIVGRATWRMLDRQRNDIHKINIPNLILHRGNLKDITIENNLEEIYRYCKLGLYVECDIWYKDHKWYLGHDYPQYVISDIDVFLDVLSNGIIHTKDGNTFTYLVHYCRERGLENEIFYHTIEDYILTTTGTIVVYPGKYIIEDSLCMMPERISRSIEQNELENISSICTDNFELIKRSDTSNEDSVGRSRYYAHTS